MNTLKIADSSRILCICHIHLCTYFAAAYIHCVAVYAHSVAAYTNSAVEYVHAAAAYRNNVKNEIIQM